MKSISKAVIPAAGLGNGAPDANDEIQLTDGIRLLAQKHLCYALEYNGKLYDIGDKLGYVKANVAYGLRQKELDRS